MGCSCGSNATASKPKSYIVTAPDGTKKAYATDIEAIAAAKRVGGTWRPA